MTRRKAKRREGRGGREMLMSGMEERGGGERDGVERCRRERRLRRWRVGCEGEAEIGKRERKGVREDDARREGGER